MIVNSYVWEKLSQVSKYLLIASNIIKTPNINQQKKKNKIILVLSQSQCVDLISNVLHSPVSSDQWWVTSDHFALSSVSWIIKEAVWGYWGIIQLWAKWAVELFSKPSYCWVNYLTYTAECIKFIKKTLCRLFLFVCNKQNEISIQFFIDLWAANDHWTMKCVLLLFAFRRTIIYPSHLHMIKISQTNK